MHNRFASTMRWSLSSLALAAVALANPPPPKAAAAPPAMPTFTLKPVVKGVAPVNKYSKEQVARGDFLVRFGGCNDCHTPMTFNPKLGMPMPDMSRMLSGHPEGAPDPIGMVAPGDQAVIGPTFTAFRLPFGVVYTANLTPDLETGSGGWTEDTFIKIFRTGKHLGGNGRPVLPPMPWASFTKLSDEDLRSIFGYLRSIPPLRNAVPAPKVPEAAMEAVSKANSSMLAF